MIDRNVDALIPVTGKASPDVRQVFGSRIPAPKGGGFYKQPEKPYTQEEVARGVDAIENEELAKELEEQMNPGD